MNTRFSKLIFSFLVMSPFIIAIVYLYFVKDVAFDTFIFGAGSWGIGCIFKLAIYQLVIRKLSHKKENINLVSLLNGFVSGITELGAAIPIFIFMGDLTFLDLLAFGIGIGTMEAFLVAAPGDPLKGTELEQASKDYDTAIQKLSGKDRIYYSHIQPIIERIIATGIHVGTRGLVYVGLHFGIILPFCIALSSFVLVDGILGYRLIYTGKLSDLKTTSKFLLLLSLLSIIIFIIFMLYWIKLQS
jgi:hypothetical protein